MKLTKYMLSEDVIEMIDQDDYLKRKLIYLHMYQNNKSDPNHIQQNAMYIRIDDWYIPSTFNKNELIKTEQCFTIIGYIQYTSHRVYVFKNRYGETNMEHEKYVISNYFKVRSSNNKELVRFNDTKDEMIQDSKILIQGDEIKSNVYFGKTEYRYRCFIKSYETDNRYCEIYLGAGREPNEKLPHWHVKFFTKSNSWKQDNETLIMHSSKEIALLMAKWWVAKGTDPYKIKQGIING